MIRAEIYEGKHIAVFGLAKTGLTMAKTLSASGAHVLAFDDDEAHQKASGLEQTNLYDCDFGRIDGFAVSPGIPLTHPVPHPLVVKAKEAGVPVFGDMEIFQAARLNLPDHNLVVITGTNGKSTTTALLAHTLQACHRTAIIGGNIGVPVLGLKPLEEGGTYVFELSSFQIDLTRTLNADIAILLNITPDHLDRHGDMSGYVSAKRRLFEMQGANQVAVIGIDDENGRAFASSLKQRVIPISVLGRVACGVFVEEGILYDAIDGAPSKKGSLGKCNSLRGIHNHQNAAAVYAAASVLGLEGPEILSAFLSFPGLAHRLQPITTINNVHYVNDSKASNTGAAAKALAAYDNIYWIAGGRFKEDSLGAVLAELSAVKKAYLIGEVAQDFERFIAGKIPTRTSGTIDQAVKDASEDAQKAGGGVVLLAPACASFDQFPNFEKRGEAFITAVEKIIGEGS